MIDIQCKGFEMGFYYPHTLNINVYNGKGDSLCTYKSFCRLRSNYKQFRYKMRMIQMYSTRMCFFPERSRFCLVSSINTNIKVFL